MFIEIKDGGLCLRVDKQKNKTLRSQLSLWGFREVEDGFLLQKDVIKVLPKLIKFLVKKSIQFQVATDCQKLIDQLNNAQNEYYELTEKAQKFKDGSVDINAYKEHVEFINKNIKRTLKEHQIKASFHLYLLGNGANFSVPGSGKTTVILTVFERLRKEGKVNTLFVVGPPACFEPWRHEFKQVIGKEPSYKVLAGGINTSRKSEYRKYSNYSELYLTTFQTLMNDQDDVCTFLGQRNLKAFLVIDEAHYIKQIDGNWAKAVLNISRFAQFRCVLTGTPIPNSFTDLFNIFDFLWQDKNPISSKDKAQVRYFEDKEEYSSAKKLISLLVGPLFYRVRKRELGLIQPIYHEPVIITMNKYERIVYEAIVNNITNYPKDDFLSNIDFVNKLRRGRMMRLRQSLSYIRLLTTTIEDYDEDLTFGDINLKRIIAKYDSLESPAKMEYLIGFVDKLQKESKKVVIWSHFINSIKLIEKSFVKKGYKCGKIIGETPTIQSTIAEEKTRDKIIREFIDKNSGVDILLANPAACAESISLHQTCHDAIYYDLSYNCAQYLQSLDRIHRVGGSESSQAEYHFLEYADSVDHDIRLALEEKAQRMYSIIDDDYNIYSMDMFDESEELAAYKRLFL